MRLPRIDRLPAAAYRFLSAAWLTVAVAAAGCAGRAAPASPAPAAGSAPSSAAPATAVTAAVGAAEADSAIARAAVAATAPKRPLKLVFRWSLQDRDAHFSGQGAARMEPPYRARLDLFGPRNEGYLSAAVVGEDLRIPAAVQAQAAVVPAPALLWTTLGVLNPPSGARLVAVRRAGEETRLEYARGPEHWRFTLVGGALRRAELDGSGAGRQTVELKGVGPLGLPQQVVFRDYAAFRELTLTLDRADEAEPFPPDVWTPGGH